MGGFDFLFTQSIALLGRQNINKTSQPVITPAVTQIPTVTAITPTIKPLKK